jgi:hypothetical protein
MAIPDPIPNSLVKPGNADDPKRVHRLEACATGGKQDAAGFIFIAVSPTLDRGGLFFLYIQG